MLAVSLEILKTKFIGFNKNHNKNLDVDNFELYQRAKSQLKFYFIVRNTKNDKSDIFSSSENMYCSPHPDPYICHFLSNYNITNF